MCKIVLKSYEFKQNIKYLSMGDFKPWQHDKKRILIFEKKYSGTNCSTCYYKINES